MIRGGVRKVHAHGQLTGTGWMAADVPARSDSSEFIPAGMYMIEFFPPADEASVLRKICGSKGLDSVGDSNSIS